MQWANNGGCGDQCKQSTSMVWYVVTAVVSCMTPRLANDDSRM